MFLWCDWFLGGKRCNTRSLAERRLDIFCVGLSYAALNVAISHLHFSDLFLVKSHRLILSFIGHPAKRRRVGFKGRADLGSVLETILDCYAW